MRRSDWRRSGNCKKVMSFIINGGLSWFPVVEKEKQSNVWRTQRGPRAEKTEENQPREEKGPWRTTGARPQPPAAEEKKVSKPVETDGWRTEKQRVMPPSGLSSNKIAIRPRYFNRPTQKGRWKGIFIQKQKH